MNSNTSGTGCDMCARGVPIGYGPGYLDGMHYPNGDDGPGVPCTNASGGKNMDEPRLKGLEEDNGVSCPACHHSAVDWKCPKCGIAGVSEEWLLDKFAAEHQNSAGIDRSKRPFTEGAGASEGVPTSVPAEPREAAPTTHPPSQARPAPVEHGGLVKRFLAREQPARDTLRLKENEAAKGNDWVISMESISCAEIIAVCEALRSPAPASAPSDKAVEAVSSIDLMQRRGAAWDIIQQALNSYDSFMLDDDYDSQRALNDIMSKMRDRFAAYAIDRGPSPQGDGVAEQVLAELLRKYGYAKAAENVLAGKPGPFEKLALEFARRLSTPAPANVSSDDELRKIEEYWHSAECFMGQAFDAKTTRDFAYFNQRAWNAFEQAKIAMRSLQDRQPATEDK